MNLLRVLCGVQDDGHTPSSGAHTVPATLAGACKACTTTTLRRYLYVRLPRFACVSFFGVLTVLALHFSDTGKASYALFM